MRYNDAVCWLLVDQTGLIGRRRTYDRGAEEKEMEQGCLGVVPSFEAEEINEDRPSASFIYAISEFLDTDPNDLLLELGYYDRSPVEIAS